MPTSPYISLVIPAVNEDGSILELCRQIRTALKPLTRRYEILLIDDGSTDRTYDEMKKAARQDKHITVYRLRRNFGKAAALNIGFELCRGEYILTMDADLQDDPIEIPRFLEKLNDGYDLVSGWKRHRHDPLHKRLPSKLFNTVTAAMSGLRLHDMNCGYKAFRREVAKALDIYGEMHRFVPVLAHWQGFRVGEIEVEHHPRPHGRSKYGVERLLRGFFDFLSIAFITRYYVKPMHFFGSIGLAALGMGFLSGGYLAVLWWLRFMGIISVGGLGTRPLLTFSLLTIILGVLFFSTGFLGEMILFVMHRRADDISKIRSPKIPARRRSSPL